MNELDVEEMRRMLRSADPASSLTLLRRDQITRLTEDAMTRATQTDMSNVTGTSPLRRRRLAAALGGGIAVVAGAAIAIQLAVAPAMSVTELNQPASGGPAAMCAEVTPDTVKQYDPAFRAKVASIEGGTVTLAVIDRFTGIVADTVTVPQGDGEVIDGAAVVFEVGKTYLISTRDGAIVSCGVSAIETPELTAIYDQAFAR